MHLHDSGLVVGHIEQQVFAQHPGVVDEDVQAAEFGNDLVDGGLDLLALGDVGRDGERRTTGGDDLVGDGCCGLAVEVEDAYPGAAAGQATRRLRTDPCAPPVMSATRSCTPAMSCTSSRIPARLPGGRRLRRDRTHRDVNLVGQVTPDRQLAVPS